MKPFLSLLLAALCSVPLAAQSQTKLKQELRAKERAAQKDPDALFAAGTWAKQQSLDADAKRIFQQVLKLDPDHEGANAALGFERVEGKWMPAEEAAKLREKARAAEMLAQGYVQVEGIWVEPDHVEDARRGVFHHDGERVTRAEKVALDGGKVRHPETGQLIDEADLEKARGGYFPLADGRWVALDEANAWHADFRRPWAFRTAYSTILSTLPLEKIKELKIYADQGYETVAPLFGGRAPSPAQRPVILVAKTESEYRDYGEALGDGTDVAGAFLVRRDTKVDMPYRGEVRAAVCHNDKDWGTRYLRHAVALAYANAVAQDTGADLPLWFLHGVGSYTSRFENDSDAGWFGKQHLAKGGVGDLRAWFEGFALSGELDSKAVAYNLYQAGLVLAYATRGGDSNATAAMLAVTDALSGKGGGRAADAIGVLERQLAASRDGIAEYLRKLVEKAP